MTFIKGQNLGELNPAKRPEVRAKISVALKGKNKSPEHALKNANARKGMKNTIEHNLRIGRALKGEKSSFWKGGVTLSPYYRSFMEQRRRARKLGNGGSHTRGDWENLKAQYNFICLHCTRSEPQIKLTEDHIIPLTKGGSDNIENIQPLCGSCNSRKNNHV